MDDNDFEVVHANQDEVEDIIAWAISTGAANWLMIDLINEHYDTVQDMRDDVKGAIEMILSNVPPILVDAIKKLTFDAIEETQEEERAVAEFIEELKEL